MVTPKWVATRTQPIAVDDAVAYLAGGARAAVPSRRRARSMRSGDLTRWSTR